MDLSIVRRTRVGAACLAVALTAAACGGDADAGGDGGSGGVSGEVDISGSSPVEPISSLVAEKFQGQNPEVSIAVDGPGTSDGFELFCNGETNISDASRPIEEEEVDACSANGIEFIELKIGIDGLSVITSTENEHVSCLVFTDLYALLGPEAAGFNNWSDADQLGRELEAPGVPYSDEPLEITAPGEESGTFDSFVEIVLEGTAEERGIPEDAWAPRPDYQASANDNVIIEGISGSPTSLGWVGYAFASENADTVKLLEISEEGGDCVAPEPETISSGKYPIARDLYIYVSEEAANEEAVEAYVDFYLSDEGLASVSEVGYVDLASEALQQTQDVWESKETGSRGL
jgi:phosphate transport system substrate-binding protein